MNILLALLTSVSFATSLVRGPLPERKIEVISSGENLEVKISTYLIDKDVLEKNVDQKCLDLDLNCEIISYVKGLEFVIEVKTIGSSKNVWEDLK